MSGKGFWIKLIGGLWTVIIVAVLFASFFPVLGQRQLEAEGDYCCENLDLILQAKILLAEDLNVFSEQSPGTIKRDVSPADLAPYLERLAPGRELNCPSGGTYKIRPLVDRNGEVVIPVCDFEAKDNDSDGNSNASEGLHIHRPSHLRDTDTGLYYRDPQLNFCE